MAFGQQTGPPASARQVEEISALLEQAGYSTFREARHIFGLTQRQASGKFTQDEAVELIERLQSGSTAAAGVDGPDRDDGRDLPERRAPRRQAVGPSERRADRVADRVADREADREADRRAELLATIPAEELADELVRRGWMCMPPA